MNKINLNRKGPGDRKWKPSKDAVICSVHYWDCQGPSKANVNVVPVHFKRSAHPRPASPPPKQRRVQKKVASVAMEPTPHIESSNTGAHTTNLDLETLYTGAEDKFLLKIQAQ